METASLATSLEANRDTDSDGQTPSRVQNRSQRLRTALIGCAAFLAGLGIATYLSHSAAPTDSVIARVNGTAITRTQFYHRLEVASGPMVLRQMIAEEKQLQFARKQGVLPPDAEIEQKYIESGHQPNFDANLIASHQTPEDIKRALRLHLIEQQALTQGVHVTEAEIQNFYHLNTTSNNPTARYFHPQTLRIAVIVSDKKADIDSARNALKQGQEFAQLACVYSKDASKADGGLLAPIVRGRSKMAQFPVLADRLFKMKAGDQIDGMEIRGFWWIIRCVESAPEAVIPFEKVKEECQTGAALTKGLAANGTKMQAAYIDFDKAASVQIVWPQYRESIATK